MIFNLSYLKLAWLFLKLLVFYICIFKSHQLAFSLFTLSLSSKSFFLGFLFLHLFSLFLENLFSFTFVWYYVSNFIIKLSLYLCLLVIDFFSWKQIFNNILILLFVLFGFFCAWKLFYEKNVNYLDKLIFYKIVVENV